MPATVSIEELQRRYDHACTVALMAVGQPDRAEQVAYRDQLYRNLQAAREAAGAESTDE
ncbi:hypothetical protein [Tsukamurella tyrosinosolvens]|uniref:Uncharacterized protein n=1 Tax=Tsukamurella tyrosinosolvens TaxID=57704 RepID=A0A1H4UP53_TSUTY|nr:hypothetical protein [Tsukamurella tyrosinosolvens]SEC69904.1 hypothetical protein SAMN04489793_2952 [Tsukamurella tyrosinosolvens]